MKLGAFVSDYHHASSTLDRLQSGDLGIFLVQNGVYHATLKAGGKASAILDKAAKIYALKEDLETRGFSPEAVDQRVKVVGYGDVVDLIFAEYPKLAWI